MFATPVAATDKRRIVCRPLRRGRSSCRRLGGHVLCSASPTGDCPRLALAELETLARALLSVLLALTHTGISCQETICAQPRPQIGIQHRQRARKPHADRSRLSADATTGNRR